MLGSYGYQIAGKTTLKSKFKKKVLVDNLVIDEELGLANTQEPNDNFTSDPIVHINRSKLIRDKTDIAYIRGDEEARKRMKVINSTSNAVARNNSKDKKDRYDSLRDSLREVDFVRINRKLHNVKEVTI